MKRSGFTPKPTWKGLKRTRMPVRAVDLPDRRNTPPKARTPQQQRRANDLRDYRQASAEQLAEFPNCQIQAPGCTSRATEISHIVGRARGGALADRKNMESACHWCGQYVEHNKAWALETGHHRHGFKHVGD